MVKFSEKSDIEQNKINNNGNVKANRLSEVEGVKVESHRIKKNSLAISIASEYNRVSKVNEPVLRQESVFQTIWQISVPFLIASLGSIGAGVILDSVENGGVFDIYEALYVCVPALMGLKGNLDMCLASRLSTQANLGNMAKKKNVVLMGIGNIAIVQVQAIGAAAYITLYSLLMTMWIYGAEVTVKAMLIVGGSAFLTATLSCFFLDFVIVLIIYSSYKYKINPDNICSPIVASVGDVVSVGFLALFANGIHKLIENDFYWIPIVIVAIYVVACLPCWLFVIKNNSYVQNILLQSWIPVLSAITLSGAGGLVLNYAVSAHPGFSAFQPIINGVGGDIVSIHTSRIATFLHQTAVKGKFPSITKLCVAPWTALIHGTFSAKTARILLPIAIVGQSIFVNIADVIQNSGHSGVRPVFFFSYISAVIIQISILLYVAHFVTHLLWKFKIDPDTAAVPYMTAFGDLLGTSLLFGAFTLSSVLGYPYNNRNISKLQLEYTS